MGAKHETPVSEEESDGGFSDFDIDIDDNELEIEESKDIRHDQEGKDEEKLTEDNGEKTEGDKDVNMEDTPQESNTSTNTTTFRLFSTSESVVIDLKADQEEEYVYVPQVRPDSYYFAEYSDAEKNQFLVACVTGEEILQRSQISEKTCGELKGKVIDLKQWNDKIMRQNKLREIELQKKEEESDVVPKTIVKRRKSRPGKATRLARHEMKQRKMERSKEDKRIKGRVAQREIESKKTKGAVVIKKKNTRRGGKKNNKKPVTNAASSGPVFRTE